MFFKRIKSEGLAHYAYFVGSDGEAAVIDPRRDCDVFLDMANIESLKIKYIFETHRNEDYAIGSIELAHFTQAEIFHGPGLDWQYGTTLKDEQEFRIGNLKITALHTPGHTDESTSYTLHDHASEELVMAFTGDTLFVGDVGRIDLYGLNEAPRLAGNIYDSIFKKLLTLGDDVIIYPAHTRGSICGSNISKREESTIGIEHKQNSLLQMDKITFIKYTVGEHHERPPYFRQMEKYNIEGPPLIQRLPTPPPLSPKDFKDKMDRGAVVLDTREPSAFSGAHIKDTYNIWLEGLPTFAGWVLPYEKPILLVLENTQYLEKAVRYLVRLGYDNIAGYLRGGVEHQGAGIDDGYNTGFSVKHLELITVQKFKEKINHGDAILILDVRSE
ncbi:MAG: MBL fold metallo-hydrolase, partial [Candidatus Bathyarchaeota archaeon]